MATTNQGKGKKAKTKGVKMSLQEFAQDSAAPQGFNVVSTRKLDWADAMENEEIDDTFTLNFKKDATKVLLPTAPKSTRGPDIDMSRVPTQPPFKAYLGNLPYDVTEVEINRFFQKIAIKDVRLPRENGRPRGFGYAEFHDRQSLIEALSTNGDIFKNRQLRVGLPGDNDANNSRENPKEEKQDRTAGDWRSSIREDQNTSAREPLARDSNQSRNGSYDYQSADKGMQRTRNNFESNSSSDYSYNNRNRYENDRTFERQTDRGFDRQSDRGFERQSDRGFERQSDRGFERQSDRGFDRQSDRGFERQSDRGFERQSDRGFDRQSDRTYDRQNDRGFDRQSDRGYDKPNDRQNNRYFKNNNRSYDRNDRYGNNDRSDGSNEFITDRSYDRQDSQSSFDRNYSSKRYEDRKYQDSDNKYQNDRRNERNFSEGKRDFGSYDKRKEERDGYSEPSPSNEETVENIPKERPKLNLKPRSKPLEETNETVVANTAIFGDAKPVNTAAREKLIEEKLMKEKEEIERKTKETSSTSSTERIRRISASSNISANSRSRKGSESGPPSHRDDFDDRSSTASRSNRQRKYSDRTGSGSDSGQKQILRRGRDTRERDARDSRDTRDRDTAPNSSNSQRYQPINQKTRGFRGAVGAPAPQNNLRRKDKDRDRERDTSDTYYRPTQLQSKSYEDEDNKLAYTSANKFAHLNDDIGDYDDNDGASD